MPANGPNSSEERAKLNRMMENDRAYLANNGGYTIVGLPKAFGNCVDTKNDNSGWHGNRTGISYELARNGKRFEACVSHKKEEVSNVRAFELNR